MAKKATPAPIVDPVPLKRDPETVIGIDPTRTGSYDYIDYPQPYGAERVVVISGQTYEHCAEDGDGVWLYRAVQF
jgi:hypothetical protein